MNAPAIIDRCARNPDGAFVAHVASVKEGTDFDPRGETVKRAYDQMFPDLRVYMSPPRFRRDLVLDAVGTVWPYTPCF